MGAASCGGACDCQYEKRDSEHGISELASTTNDEDLDDEDLDDVDTEGVYLEDVGSRRRKSSIAGSERRLSSIGSRRRKSSIVGSELSLASSVMPRRIGKSRKSIQNGLTMARHASSFDSQLPFYPQVTEVEFAESLAKVKDTAVGCLLHPFMTAPIGWPMSKLMLHHVALKKVLTRNNAEARRVLRPFLFECTKRPDTHRQCNMDLLDHKFKIQTERKRISNGEPIRAAKDQLVKSRRLDAAAQGVILGPGVCLMTMLVGGGDAQPEQKQIAATACWLHLIHPGNPHSFTGMVSFFQSLLHLASQSFHDQGYPPDLILAALRALLPEVSQELDDVVVESETDWDISTDSRLPRILHHKLQVQWNLQGLQKRYGNSMQYIFKNKPRHNSYLINAAKTVAQADSEEVACRVYEDDAHYYVIRFCTTETGDLVWTDTDGKPWMPNGQPHLCPALLPRSNFHIRMESIKLPIRGLGCFRESVDLPNCVFSLDIVQESTIDVTLKCVHIDPYPMEWLYKAFFDARLMRVLTKSSFFAELRFGDDDVQLRMALELPKFAYAMKALLKLCSGLLLDIVFKQSEENDPIPVLLGALGRDCAVLEESIV